MHYVCNVIFIAVLFYSYVVKSDNLPPVFLINGILGSKLYISESGVQYPQELGCTSTDKERKIWITEKITNVAWIGDRACEFFRLQPVFDNSTNTFHDKPGINISTHFADLDALQCLITDVGWKCSWLSWMSKETAYYHDFIEYAKTVYKFTPSVNLMGAAYDWRYSPEMQTKYFENLILEIEKAVNRTKLPAIIVAHSMGNKVLNYFLTHATKPEWRKMYINKTINVAPAFGGSVATMQELSEGNPIEWLGIGLSQEIVRNFTRSIPAAASLLPSPNVFSSSRTLLSVDGKDFNSGNIKEFLNLINSSHLSLPYGKSEEKQPDVPMLVIIGNKPDTTPSRYVYGKDFHDKKMTVNVTGDDRIEAAVIEELCQKWKNNGAIIDVVKFPKGHTELIRSQEFFDIFGNAVVKKLPDAEFYPVLRNIMLERTGKVCFSAKPHATCRKGTSAKTLKAGTIASFVCFHKGDKIAIELKESVAENSIFDLSLFDVAFSQSIEVAEICIDSTV